MRHKTNRHQDGAERITIKTDNHILARDAPRLIHSGEKGAVSDQVESSTANSHRR